MSTGAVPQEEFEVGYAEKQVPHEVPHEKLLKLHTVPPSRTRKVMESPLLVYSKQNQHQYVSNVHGQRGIRGRERGETKCLMMNHLKSC
jgi:hypothetical protein